MKTNQNTQEKFNLLRIQAEKMMGSKDFVSLSVDYKDPLKLVHELQTLQIELEMQNEELQNSQQELIRARESYADLYESAPVGYITVNEIGRIQMANKAFAEMLASEKEEIIGKPLSDHILFEDQDIYYLYVKNLSSSKNQPICELRMNKKSGEPFYVQLESTIISGENDSPDSHRTVVIDITERKRAEKLLQTSEERLKALCDASFEAIFFYNNGLCIDQNTTAEKMFGYTVSDALGKQASEWVVSEDRRRVQNNIFSNYEKPFKITALRSDGSTFPCEMQLRPTTCDGYSFVAAALRDISDRKKVEDELFFKEDIINASSSVIATCDLDGNTTYGNPSFMTSLGFKDTDEFIGKPFWRFWQLEDRVGDIEKSLRNYGAWTSEIKAVRKDGTMFDAQISADTVFNKKGNAVALSTTAVDITDRKKAVDALKESEEKYRTMMGSMMDAAYICSPDFRVVYMNPKMISRIGEDKTGEPCYKAIFNLDEKCTKCVFDQVQKGKHVTHEVTSSMDNRIYGVTNSPVYNNDGTISMLTILRDITKNKLIENQLHQARKMESIGTLAGGIAHDFNNLLYMIIGNTELAMAQTSTSAPVHSNLQEIKSACLKSASIIKQLLNFSRKTDQKLKPVNSVTVIDDALKFLRSIIPTTIGIRKNLPQNDITILADPIQIHQVFMNIFTNATQAMEETGGFIEINVKRTIIKEDVITNPSVPPGDYLKISISDTGPGIADDILEHIFDPYYTTKDVGKGSGMGLAVVHGIVKNHNGTISVSSQLNKGTTFNIFFPVVTETPEVKQQLIDTCPHGTETILFVDDEETIVSMQQQILEHLGYQVEAKMNPEKALALFKSKPDYFDLIITDMTMPQMTGAQLSEKILEIRPEMPIIICTGHSSIMNEEKAQKLGVAGYLMKPASMSKIANKIRTVLSKE